MGSNRRGTRRRSGAPRANRALVILYARRQARGLLVILALSAGVAVVGALQPWPLKILVDYGLRSDPVPEWLRALLAQLRVGQGARPLILLAAAGSIGLFAVNSVLGAALDWRWTVVGRRMMNDLASDLFHRLQRRSLLAHSRASVGDALSRLGTDTWSIQELTAGLIMTPARHVITIMLLCAAGWTLSPQIALLSIALAPILGSASWLLGRRLKQEARRSRDAQSRLLTFVQQTLAAIPVVQAFSREDFNRQRFDGLAAEAAERSRRRALVDGIFGMVTGLIAAGGVWIVLYVGGLRVLSGSLSIGGLLVFVAYMRNLQGASEGLLNAYGALKPVEASFDRVLEVLNASDTLPEREGAVALPVRPPGMGRHVSIEHVTFCYAAGRLALDDVSVQVPAGCTVAFVGATGAGKTTLVSLVPRFFDPAAGRVSIDGVDLRDARLASVRDQVALVLQEPFIFPLTVSENIAYGRPEAGRSEIVEAARAANAHEFILRLPFGYKTVVGEQGATLSGGEKQRLAIARAFLKNAPILILDEPTSALDAESESLLVEALRRLMTGRTTLIVGHRLSTVRHADEIVVLDGGRIVERGTHEQLLSAGGIYHACYRWQVPGTSQEVVQ